MAATFTVNYVGLGALHGTLTIDTYFAVPMGADAGGAQLTDHYTPAAGDPGISAH